MSEAYNPETSLYEQLESLTVEARQIKQKLDQATGESDRHILERQLLETEHKIESLKRRLRK